MIVLSGSADAMLINILSFSSNAAALSSSYSDMDDDTTNSYEKEHFEFLLHDTFLQIVHHWKFYFWIENWMNYIVWNMHGIKKI